MVNAEEQAHLRGRRLGRSSRQQPPWSLAYACLGALAQLQTQLGVRVLVGRCVWMVGVRARAEGTVGGEPQQAWCLGATVGGEPAAAS